MQDRMVVPAHLRDGRVDVQRVLVAREPVQRLRLANVLLALGVRRPRARLDLRRERHARAREAGGADRKQRRSPAASRAADCPRRAACSVRPRRSHRP